MPAHGIMPATLNSNSRCYPCSSYRRQHAISYPSSSIQFEHFRAEKAPLLASAAQPPFSRCLCETKKNIFNFQNNDLVYNLSINSKSGKRFQNKCEKFIVGGTQIPTQSDEFIIFKFVPTIICERKTNSKIDDMFSR